MDYSAGAGRDGTIAEDKVYGVAHIEYMENVVFPDGTNNGGEGSRCFTVPDSPFLSEEFSMNLAKIVE